MKTSADLGQFQGEDKRLKNGLNHGLNHGWNGGPAGDAQGLRDGAPCAVSDDGSLGRSGWEAESLGLLDCSEGGGMVGAVEAGIRARGYHEIPVGEVAGLAGGSPVCGVEFLRRLHRFASMHGWEAAAPRGLGHVLFQPIGDRRVMPSLWRLQRTLQR